MLVADTVMRRMNTASHMEAVLLASGRAHADAANEQGSYIRT